jgi:DNA topoisomerase-3
MLRSIPLPELCSPQLTGEWEHKLRKMEHRELTRAEFMKEIKGLTIQIVDKARQYKDEGFESTARIEGPCPKCGGRIKETFKCFECSKEGCGFQIYKSIASKSLTTAEVEELLKNKKIGPLPGFRSKLGRPFAAMLVIADDGRVSMTWDGATDANGVKAPIEFINDQKLGDCPLCKSPVRETNMAYCCEKRALAQPECEFRISKTIKERLIPVEQIVKLLRDKKTDLLDKFISAKRRPFSAYLTLTKAGKLAWEFQERAPRGATPKPAAGQPAPAHHSPGAPPSPLTARVRHARKRPRPAS